MSTLETDLKNRRRAKRVNRAVQVMAMDPQSRTRLSVALNISATGARMVLPQRVPQWFTLQFDAQTKVLARPVWQRQLDRSSVVGVHFEFRSENERRQMIQYLQRLAA